MIGIIYSSHSFIFSGLCRRQYNVHGHVYTYVCMNMLSFQRSINTFQPEEEELLGGGQQRTNPLKCWIVVLTIALIVAMAAILGLSIGLGVATTTMASSSTGTCLTEECVQLAASVLSRMDTSVNPCQNFYNFSCGRWMNNNIIPPGTVGVPMIVHLPVTLAMKKKNCYTMFVECFKYSEQQDCIQSDVS